MSSESEQKIIFCSNFDENFVAHVSDDPKKIGKKNCREKKTSIKKIGKKNVQKIICVYEVPPPKPSGSWKASPPNLPVTGRFWIKSH